MRPGLQPERWVNRNNMAARGILELDSDVAGTPRELSIYTTEGYYRGDACRLRRMTVRLDGFVSAQAPLRGGEVLTRPLRFTGSTLLLNLSASAAGSVRVELQEESGEPIEGFTLQDSDVSALSGQPRAPAVRAQRRRSIRLPLCLVRRPCL